MAEPTYNPTRALLHIHARFEAEDMSEQAAALRTIVSHIDADPIRSADLLAAVWHLMDLFPDTKDRILEIAKGA